MTWLIVIIVVAVIGGIIGYFTSDSGKEGEGALEGAVAGAFGCGSIIFQIMLGLLSLYLLVRLGAWLFG